jgi:hypothetical protein
MVKAWGGLTVTEAIAKKDTHDSNIQTIMGILPLSNFIHKLKKNILLLESVNKIRKLPSTQNSGSAIPINQLRRTLRFLHRIAKKLAENHRH